MTEYCPHCGEPKIERDLDGTCLCLYCGFYTAPLFIENQLEKIEKNIPKLVKDLKIFDKKQKQYWYPIIINIPNIGAVYPDGTSTENWKWAVAPVVTIPPPERIKYPMAEPGNFYETRLAVELAIFFGQKEFEKAIEKLGYSKED